MPASASTTGTSSTNRTGEAATAGGEARFWEKAGGGRVSCLLCPNGCRIAEGKHGTCGVRRNDAGRLTVPFYARISSLAVDPIEKKPLYHFHPGAGILSVGFAGCSFRCGFCQNFEISQTTDLPLQEMTPQSLVEAAVRKGTRAVAYTYSEPLVHAEYVLDASRLAHERGLANVLVTNGYVNPEPAEEILSVTDAANIDLKSFDPAFYREECGGKLDEVKRFIAQAARRIHVEVTTLVIPGKNDGAVQIAGIARFLASISPDIPLHLSAYFPRYRYGIPPTPPETLLALRETAREDLRYVYTGNIAGAGSDTLCPECGRVLIRRRGYQTGVADLKPSPEGAVCGGCGIRIPVVGAF